MRLPESLLSRVRGPLAVCAIVGCSAPATAPVVPEPVAAPVVLAPPPPPDPVAYDAIAEAARFERSDREIAAELELRDDRIRAAERAESMRGIGSIGTGRWSWDRVMVACGRG